MRDNQATESETRNSKTIERAVSSSISFFVVFLGLFVSIVCVGFTYDHFVDAEYDQKVTAIEALLVGILIGPIFSAMMTIMYSFTFWCCTFNLKHVSSKSWIYLGSAGAVCSYFSMLLYSNFLNSSHVEPQKSWPSILNWTLPFWVALVIAVLAQIKYRKQEAY